VPFQTSPLSLRMVRSTRSLMSGLENVLGNVYGNKDDQPQETDLNDVQESMDALAEATDPEEPEASEALDELSEWIGFNDDSDDTASETGAPEDTASETGALLDTASIDEDDDDIFATDSFAFLEEDSDADSSADDTADEHPAPESSAPESSAAEDLEAVAEPEGSGHSRAGWLDDLDDVEDESAPNWMDELTEDQVSPEHGSESNDTTSAEPERGSPIESSNEGEDFEDAGPTLDDLAAASAPEAPAEPVSPMPPEDQDEQWLDDLFTTDLGDDPDAAAVAASTMPISAEDAQTDEQAQPVPDAVPLDTDGASARATESDSSRTVPVADIAVNTDVTPAWAQLQATTAEASASAAGIAAATPGTTSGAALAGDWIRSDDDILPARGRGKRRKQTLDIAELAPDQDPIELFAPVEQEEPKSRRARKSKREKDTDVSSSETAKTSKPKRATRSKRKEKSATPADTLPDTSTDSTPETSIDTKPDASDDSKPGAVTELVEPGLTAEVDETDQGSESESSAPAAEHTSLGEVLAAPPIIADVGMPEPPDAVEAFLVPDDELGEVETRKPKRKLFKRSGK